MRKLASTLAGKICAAFLSFNALADDTITIKYAFPQSLSHHFWIEAGKPFTDQITAKTNGKVKFEIYPSNQLGKDYLSLLQSGLVDVATISTSTYSAELFPLTSVVELPCFYNTSCEGADMFWKLSEPSGLLEKSEFARADIHPLFVAITAPFVIMTSKKEIHTLEDVASLKLRAACASSSRIATALGAAAVNLPATELYEALLRGTLDGAIYPFSGAFAFDLQAQLKYSIDGISMGGAPSSSA